MIITIDGPSGSGKTTIARNVANILHLAHLNTGALYRALAYACITHQVEYTKEPPVTKALPLFTIEVQRAHDEVRYYVNGEDVSRALHTQSVAHVASIISAYPSVRMALLPIQRSFAKHTDIICEGRDMGTTVFPSAEVKIFLTASASVRARRRFLELHPSHESLEHIEEEIIARDQRDYTRLLSPLTQPQDSIVIDSSTLSPQEVVDIIIAAIHRCTGE